MSEQKQSVEFHIMPVMSQAFKDSFGRFELDEHIVRDRLDKFLRDVIETRMSDFGMDARIKQMMDRRIEIAVKAVMQRVEAEATTQAVAQIRQQVKEIVEATPIAVRIDVGQHSDACLAAGGGQ